MGIIKNIFGKKKLETDTVQQLSNVEPTEQRNLANAQYQGAVAGYGLWGRTTSQFVTQQDAIPIRNTARKYVRENPVASRFILQACNYVLGPNGPQIVPNILSKKGESVDKSTTKAVKDSWEKWCQLGNCSTDTRLNFKDFQEVVFKSWKRDGEVIVLILRGNRANNKWGFRLKVVECDQLYEFNNSSYGENIIRNSIEFDRYGQVVAYHVLPYHPGDYQGQSIADGPSPERIMAADVLHVFRVERPSQTRGTSALAPSLFAIAQIQEYEQACLQSAKNAAQLSTWIKFNNNIQPDQLSSEQMSELMSMKGNLGDLGLLMPGMEIQSIPSDQPTETFDAFRKSQLNSIAMGLNSTYLTLTGDVSAVNYSSGRLALMADRDAAKADQSFFEDHFIRPIYEAWLECSVLSGAFSKPLSFSDVDRLSGMKVVFRSQDWIDPKNDVDSTIAELQNGLTSFTQVAQEKGLDLEDFIVELQKDKDILTNLGLNLPWMNGGINTTNNNTIENNNDGQKQDKDKDGE